MTPEQLITLAERVEGLAGPCRETDARIWCALNGKKYMGFFVPYGKPPETAVEYTEPPKRTRRVSRDGDHAKPVTASLDAALTLVPEKWRWEVMNFYVDVEYTRSVNPVTGKADESFLVSDGAHAMLERPARLIDDGDPWPWNGDWTDIRIHHCATAATPALALCAAALRALAAEREEKCS